jgi:hypothetical protein
LAVNSESGSAEKEDDVVKMMEDQEHEYIYATRDRENCTIGHVSKVVAVKCRHECQFVVVSLLL